MKTIGLIGGMSWESTVPYYRLINEMVKERLGGLRSAKIVLFSVDFHEVAKTVGLIGAQFTMEEAAAAVKQSLM